MPTRAMPTIAIADPRDADHDDPTDHPMRS